MKKFNDFLSENKPVTQLKLSKVDPEDYRGTPKIVDKDQENLVPIFKSKSLFHSMVEAILVDHCKFKLEPWSIVPSGNKHEEGTGNSENYVNLTFYQLTTEGKSIGRSSKDIDIKFFEKESAYKALDFLKKYPNDLIDIKVFERREQFGPSEILDWYAETSTDAGIKKAIDFLREFYKKHRGEKLVGEIIDETLKTL